MRLIIHDIPGKYEFTVTNFNVNKNEIQIESAELSELINSLDQAKEVAAPPAAPPVEAYILEPTEKMNGMTIEQFKDNGWTEDQLIANGYCTKLPVESTIESAPEVPETPATPAPAPVAAEVAQKKPEGDFEHGGKQYKMTVKSAGASADQFIAKGWSVEDLIAHGYAEPLIKEAVEYPYLNENNEWVDAAGTIFDKEIHGWTKQNKPGVTVKGLFKKKRNIKVKDEEVNSDPLQTDAAKEVAPPPAAPAAPQAPSTAAPAAPQAPSAGVAAPAAPAANMDENLDAELEDILKDW